MGFYLLDHPNPNGDRFYRSRRSPLSVIVVHVTAGLEDIDGGDVSAERTAQYAATTDRKVSWHVGCDTDSVVELLPEWFTAWAAVGFNSSGYHLEISKSHTNWSIMPDAWVEATLRNAAKAVAPVVERYVIPLRVLSREEAAAGVKGFASHGVLDPARRTDPGLVGRSGNRVDTFPWERLFGYVRELLVKEEDVTVDELRRELAPIKARLGELEVQVEVARSDAVEAAHAAAAARDPRWTWTYAQVRQVLAHLGLTEAK